MVLEEFNRNIKGDHKVVDKKMLTSTVNILSEELKPASLLNWLTYNT